MRLLHFLDMGICAYLLKLGKPEVLENGAMSGAFLKFVFSDLYKSCLNAGKEPSLFYYWHKCICKPKIRSSFLLCVRFLQRDL
jgi:hypothetical protein